MSTNRAIVECMKRAMIVEITAGTAKIIASFKIRGVATITYAID